MPNDFFPQRPKIEPKIYAYITPDVKNSDGWIKVGYTTRALKERIDEQTKTAGIKAKILFCESAMYSDGSTFTDKKIHSILENKGILRRQNTEWFKCTVEDVKAAYLAVKNKTKNIENRTEDFKMRYEQQEAVHKAMNYFTSAKKENPHKSPKFLWNCKMRFGKTFASYELAKTMELKRILILTFKPAVESAWDEDLMRHVDFEGWQFISNKDAHSQSITIDEAYNKADKAKSIVCFGSFQDLLGTNESGGIKTKNEFIHLEDWDIVIFDEYHFGAWRDNAKKLFTKENDEEEFDSEKYSNEESGNAYDESFLPINSKYYLYLSGTPFRALNSGEFIEEQIFNWTYTDEQKAKENWGKHNYSGCVRDMQGAERTLPAKSGAEAEPEIARPVADGTRPKGNNPYAALPRMVMMTYQIPDSIQRIAKQGEFDEFDLNVFFAAEGNGKDAKFKYENEVQKWLDLIRGAYLPSSIDDMKLGQDKKPPMPFSDTRLLNVLSHTLWFLPNVASCCAMKNLLAQKQNLFYHDYKVNLCAGTSAGIGVDALDPVLASMGNPLTTKTITLTCGKLTTGVTVKPWSGIFMLRNLKSPETYFQSAFRVQSPWEVQAEENDVTKKVIMKKECYVFDFALDRALKQIADYSCQLDVNEGNPEKKVAEFINFLPVLAYDGSTMKQINAQDVLDIAMSGTSATLLAKRWESALLVNVDNNTLERLMNNQEAMDALMRIEGFRSLNKDIETIINKSNAVKKAKQENKEPTQEEKNILSEEEKEYKSMRKQIQEKLIKFATRVPVFMYLTDYRERTLRDVITQLEPELFMKVTGLSVKDFELLVSLNVFNGPLMNDAIYKFKRYEDASLNYTGINMHEGENVGLYDTVLSAGDFYEEK